MYIICMPLSICHYIYTYIMQNYSVLKKNEIKAIHCNVAGPKDYHTK